MRCLASWHEPKACRVLFLLLLFSMILNGVASAQDSAGSDAVILEEVRFILFGRERQEIGQVQLLGEQYRIQLFDSGISTYYSVTISSEDLLASAPITAERAASVLQERASLIVARSVLREARRKERRERAATRRPKEAPDRRGAALDAPPPSRAVSSVPSLLSDPVSSGSSLEESNELLHRLNQVCEELLQRSADLLEIGRGCKESLRIWRSASDGNNRLFSNLREESFSLVEQTATITGRIQSRIKEIDWTITQIKTKELRSRDLPDHVDGIRRRVLQCEKIVDSLEVLLSACADGLKVLGDPIVKTIESEVQQDSSVVREAVVREPSRPAPSSARSETQVVRSVRSPDGSSLATTAAKKATRASGNKTPGVIEETDTAEDIDAVASSESEEESLTDSNSGSVPGGFTTLLIGGILGALLVLVLTKVLRSLL
ncbi:MAG: hypothetical protein AAEJ47_09855 [Planctomycetota bacterium]